MTLSKKISSKYRFIRPMLPGFVFFVLLVGAFNAWQYLVLNDQKITFYNSSHSIKDEISSKINIFEQMMSNMKQLTGPEGIDKKDWEDYHKALDISEYKGLTSISYSKLVKNSEKATYEKENYKIYPKLSKDEYLPVTYINPPSPDFLGFDSGTSNPERYAWILKARTSGHRQRTNLYEFKSGASALPTKLMFITAPVYKAGKPITNDEERFHNYAGAIIATFAIEQFIPALFDNVNATRYFDDIELFDSTNNNAKIINDKNIEKVASNYTLIDTAEINMGNRPLKLDLGKNLNKPSTISTILWYSLFAAIGTVVYLTTNKINKK